MIGGVIVGTMDRASTMILVRANDSALRLTTSVVNSRTSGFDGGDQPGGAAVTYQRFPFRDRAGSLAARMSFSRCLIIAAACAFAASRAEAQATIEGRVELPKTGYAPVLTKRYDVLPPGGVLRPDPPRAIVYLEGSSAKQTASLPKKQVLQKDLMFSPGVLAVQVGTTVEFPNGDPTYHNIFSYSPAKRFDLGRYRPEERPIPSQTFDTPGLVTLRCDIHDHMRGQILVLETPHFVTTETDGRYRLSGVPPGKYKLKVWVDGKVTHERAVELRSGVTTGVDFP